jgi:ribonuclease III
MKSHLVCEQTLHTLAKDLRLGDFILLSNGEERGGGRLKSAILADAVEAIFGAIYLDQGLFVAKKFILECYKPHLIEVVNQPVSRDAKSKLNEIRQKEGKSPPRYETLKEWGNDHAKEYEVGIFFDQLQIASGVGSSKKEASRQAALNAYQLHYHKDGATHG